MSLLNYKLNINNIVFKKKKKIIILLIRRSPGEVDWILPLLFSLKEKYNIFTIFRFEKTLNSIKENKTLFNMWKNVSFGYTIEPKMKSIFLRTLNFIFKKTVFKNYINKKFINNFYSISIIKELIVGSYIRNLEIDAIFTEFTSHSPWIKQFQSYNKKIKTFYFPHTTSIFGTRAKKVIDRKKQTNKYLLLGNKFDYNFWKKRFPDTNIIITGYLKYDKYWLNKIIRKNKFKNKKIIYISYSGYISKYIFEKYEDLTIKIIKICSNLKNVKTIFKIHPMTNENVLKKILKNYPQKNLEISKKNQLNLVKNSDIFVSLYSSASNMDGLALGKIPLELWNVMKDQKLQSKFKKLNLSIPIQNGNELKNKINLFLNNDFSKFNLRYKKKFLLKNFIFDGSVNSARKKILNILYHN